MKHSSKSERMRGEFLRDISAYNDEVLRPLGLAASTSEAVRSKSLSKICLVGEKYVWKFYRPRKAGAGRNYAAAAPLLRRNGIRAPEIVFAAFDIATTGEFRLGCLVMERLKGARFEAADLLQNAKAAGETLAQLHSIRSERKGPLVPPRERENPINPENMEGPELLFRTGNELVHLAGHDSLAPIERSLRQCASALKLEQGPFHFIHGDLSGANLIREEGERIGVIDLDESCFSHFGSDLMRVLTLTAPARMLRPGIITPRILLDDCERYAKPITDAYFSKTPAAYQDSWHQTKRFHFALSNVRRYVDLLTLLKPGPADSTRANLHTRRVWTDECRSMLDGILQEPEWLFPAGSHGPIKPLRTARPADISDY